MVHCRATNVINTLQTAFSLQLENKLSSIEVRLSDYANPWHWSWPTTLTFNPLWAMVMTYLHAKDQGQRSDGSKTRVDRSGGTDIRKDRGNCITWLANVVGNWLPVGGATPGYHRSQRDAVMIIAAGFYRMLGASCHPTVSKHWSCYTSPDFIID